MTGALTYGSFGKSPYMSLCHSNQYGSVIGCFHLPTMIMSSYVKNRILYCSLSEYQTWIWSNQDAAPTNEKKDKGEGFSHAPIFIRCENYINVRIDFKNMNKQYLHCHFY